MSVRDEWCCVDDCPLGLNDYDVEYDASHRVLWGLFKPRASPGFTQALLSDIQRHDQLLKINEAGVLHKQPDQPIDYYVWGSRLDKFYSSGGDLAYFVHCITTRDRPALMRYAASCIDVIYPRICNYFAPNLITLSLIQGDALGGGLEAALASDVIIAEEQAKLGFPEILFNLFPGMGAYSLLFRRIGSRKAEELMLSGKVFPARYFHELGLVDIVVRQGEGEQAVYDYVERNRRRKNGMAAVYSARREVSSIHHSELMKITTQWVDAAFRLQGQDLRMMMRLVHSQCRYR